MKMRTLIAAIALSVGGAGLFTADVQAATKECSNASLKGSYGLYRTGSTPAGNLAALGILSFDGKGNLFGRQSISRNGTYTFDVPIPFSPYEIQADCTGRGIMPDGSEVFRIVVTDGGKGFYIFSETSGNAVYGVGRRIDASDDDD